MKLPEQVNTVPSESLDLVIKNHVLRIYQDSQRNKELTARKLGVSRATLYRWLAAWGKGPQEGAKRVLEGSWKGGSSVSET
jgi:transcriptional regulator of acetoin/glycerol metabolism